MILYNDEAYVDAVASLLADRKVGVVPADTIYGISSLAEPGLAHRILEIKMRPENKSFIMLSSLEWLRSSTLDVPDKLFDHWPCPLTAIVRDTSDGRTQAVRVPADPFIQAIVERTGPIWSTSCNLSGRPSLMTYDEILPVFGERVDFIVRRRNEDLTGLPSTLIDCTSRPFRVVRQGAYDVEGLI